MKVQFRIILVFLAFLVAPGCLMLEVGGKYGKIGFEISSERTGFTYSQDADQLKEDAKQWWKDRKDADD